MERDAARLSAAAARVEADLRRTTGRAWTCSISPDHVLQVSDGVHSERLRLEDEVEDEPWFAPEDASPDELDEGLDADADELVAGELAEFLRSVGVAWPICVDHRRLLGVCSGWWYCEGEPYHDVAAVGELQTG